MYNVEDQRDHPIWRLLIRVFAETGLLVGFCLVIPAGRLFLAATTDVRIGPGHCPRYSRDRRRLIDITSAEGWRAL
jgi:hypothetical protein